MANEVNLKANIKADSSGFVKGAKEVRDNLKDLDKVGKETLSSIGGLFGINTDKIEKMASAAKGLGEKLTKSGNDGASSFGQLLKSIDKVSVGIASIGIAGVVSGFKLLREEAEAFESTIEGANLKLQANAYISTYQQVLRDLDSQFGKTTSEGMAAQEMTLKRMWALAKNAAVNTFTGNKSSFGDAFASGLVKDTYANDIASQAYAIQGKINDATDKQRDNLVKIADLSSRIAQLREDAINPENDIKTRQDAIAQASALIAEKYNMQVEAQQELVTALQEMSDLATDDKNAAMNLINAQVELINLSERRSAEERSILKTATSITNEAHKQAEEYRKMMESKAAMAAMRDSLNNFDLSISDNAKQTIQNAIDTQIGKDLTVEAKLAVKADTKSVEAAMADFTPVISNAFESLGENLGSLFTDLRSGENVWQNFSNSAVSAFGDMAISVGKMAIATGTATLGIKAALESLNGYVAIAAGVALVALGTAVKQGMASIASGNYSASNNVASSGSYGVSMADYQQREIDVNISGTFTASGNSLVAVLDNENKRKTHTC